MCPFTWISGGHLQILGDIPNLSNFYMLNWIVIQKFLLIFLFKFEPDVDSFGPRSGVDDSEVVSAIALVLNSPANLLFLY